MAGPKIEVFDPKADKKNDWLPDNAPFEDVKFVLRCIVSK